MDRNVGIQTQQEGELDIRKCNMYPPDIHQVKDLNIVKYSDNKKHEGVKSKRNTRILLHAHAYTELGTQRDTHTHTHTHTHTQSRGGGGRDTRKHAGDVTCA